jgi:hypothetical protein
MSREARGAPSPQQELNMNKCSICGEKYEGYGNNARPINDGVCCGSCNGKVLRARLQRHDMGLPMRALDHELVEMKLVKSH